MRIPDPKANTTTEAYLAYKAGYLEESELKPVLYEPYLHFDAWLAYWAGLANDFPAASISKKNLFNVNGKSAVYRVTKSVRGQSLTVVATANGVGYASVVIPNSEELLGRRCTISYNADASAGEARLRIATCSISSPDVVKTIIASKNGNGDQTLSFTFPSSFGTGEDAFAVLFYIKNGEDIVIGDSAIYSNIQIEFGNTPSEYEPYATPEMLCDEEALVAYLSGVTDTYPEEIKDPYDVRIVGYLKHLASIRWPEPDYPVNNEEFYLSTMEPTHTSNSEPSADIELDTAEGKIIGVEAYGDTYQQTYSGANLFNFRDTNGVGEGTTVSDDGFISQSKDNSSGTSSAFNNYFTHNLALDTSTTYIVVVEVQAVSGTGMLVPVGNHSTAQSVNQLEYSFSDLHAGDIIVGQFNTKSSFSGDTGLRGYTRYGAGESGSITYRISVLADTSITPETFVYQPYTGGIPAPNPDYPQNVQVVTGEQTVLVTGKNLFDKVAEVETSPNYSLNPDGTITTDASNAQTGRKYMTLTMNPGTYTLSFRPYFSGVENPGIRFTIRNIDTSTDYIAKNINNPENGSLQVNSFTVENTTSVGFCIIPQARLEDGQTFYFYDTQLEQGSTATAYEPYQEQSYPISLGSIELCKIGDYQDYIYKSGEDWYLHKEINKIIIDGSEDEDLRYTSGDHSRFSLWGVSGIMLQPFAADAPVVAISNCFMGANLELIYDNRVDNAISSHNTASIFNIKATRFTDLESFKDFLRTNPVIVNYVMSSEYFTDTKITDATLVGQLEALAGADTYNEKTFIGVTATDPNLPALLKVEAYKY